MAKNDTPAPKPEQAAKPEPKPQAPPQSGKKSKKKGGFFRTLFKTLLILILVLLLAVIALFVYLTVNEYDPEPITPAEVGAYDGNGPFSGSHFTILSLNTGYGGLDASADFFMDGGSGVNPASEQLVERNMHGIENIITGQDADFVFLQEVDTKAKRSFGHNQWEEYAQAMEGYEARFALNYCCDYVPIPLPQTIGWVNSGVATFSRYDITEATRYSLPCPFSWPMRIANLKRCMLVSRIPMESGAELVLVNFHLEAYDDGEGKEEQTRQLLDFVQAEYAKGNYVIAGGDFNQSFPGTADSYPIKETSEWAPGVLDPAPDGWQYAFDENIPTCRLLNQPLDAPSALTQYFVIDGFLLSPNLKVDWVATLDEGFTYTDHNPVKMSVSFAE